MNIARLAFFLLAAVPASLCGASMSIEPAAPTAAAAVTIRIEDEFRWRARVTSATIVRTGEFSFLAELNILVNCEVLEATPVSAVLTVGPLPTGDYSVDVLTRFQTEPAPVCGILPPFTRTASFHVSPIAVPAADHLGLFLLALGIAIAATSVLELTAR